MLSLLTKIELTSILVLLWEVLMAPYKLIAPPRAGWSMEPWWREELKAPVAFMKHRPLQEWVPSTMSNQEVSAKDDSTAGLCRD
jgi:hypothetical protein